MTSAVLAPARGSAMLGRAGGCLGTLLEGAVHPLEGGQGAPVQGFGQQRYEYATKVFLPDEANAATVERLNGEAVLAVEDARHE